MPSEVTPDAPVRKTVAAAVLLPRRYALPCASIVGTRPLAKVSAIADSVGGWHACVSCTAVHVRSRSAAAVAACLARIIAVAGVLEHHASPRCNGAPQALRWVAEGLRISATRCTGVIAQAGTWGAAYLWDLSAISNEHHG